MRLNHLPVLAFVLATAVPSEANLFARGTQSLARTANRLHHRAAKRSAGLAKDLRRAFSGMYAQELAATTGSSQRVYCVNNGNAPSLAGSGNSSSSSGSSGSSNGTSSSSVQSHQHMRAHETLCTGILTLVEEANSGCRSGLHGPPVFSLNPPLVHIRQSILVVRVVGCLQVGRVLEA